MANINIKRYNGDTWEIHYPKTTIGQVINLSSQLANMQSDIDGKAASSHGHTIAQVTGLQTALDGKENTPYLTISRNDGGGAKFTKFLEVDYNGTDSNKAVYVKVSMRAGHGNAVSYVFNEDIFIQVASTGDVTVRSPKYYAGVSTLSGRYYGDIAYTVDALNKIVKFYTVIGQYTTAQFTPPIRLNASTAGTVTPITGTYVDDFDSLNAIYAPRQWYGVKSTDAEFIYEGDSRLTNARTPTTHSHPKSEITNFDNEVLALSPPWKLIRSTQIVIPTTLTANNVTVVSGNYYNKILAFEVRVVTGTDSFETHIVFGRMGSDSTTLVSATYDRLYSWSTFDGQYFKTHSFKAYVSNSTTSTMTVGNAKHLIGNFSGASIEWTTNTTTSIYLERIWLVN